MAQVWQIKTINSDPVPIPTSLKIAYYTLEKDAGANMLGNMIHNVINHKKKFFITTPPLSQTDLDAFLEIMIPDALTIVYYDPFNSGTETTGYFYHGDIEVEVLWIKNESMTDVLYKGLSINLIEN